MDANGDGTLTIEELEMGLAGREDAFSIMELMQRADTDGSGDIDYTEFIAATIDQNIYMNQGYLRQAFDMFDSDKSGYIDANEIKQLIGGLGNLVS